MSVSRYSRKLAIAAALALALTAPLAVGTATAQASSGCDSLIKQATVDFAEATRWRNLSNSTTGATKYLAEQKYHEAVARGYALLWQRAENCPANSIPN